MSVVYDNNNSNYEKGFAIGYENIRVMYHDKGAMETIRYIESIDQTAKKDLEDQYTRGYLDGCIKAFKHVHNS